MGLDGFIGFMFEIFEQRGEGVRGFIKGRFLGYGLKMGAHSFWCFVFFVGS